MKIIEQNNIAYVIDIHGCKSGYCFDIDIGTNNGDNVNNEERHLGILKRRLSQVGETTIDRVFKASGDVVISNYIHKKSNVPCFQIEISSEIRKNSDRLLKMLNQFEIIIKELSREIEKKENRLEL